ncbi:hypothetical protein [Arthrobacter sp. PM3]|uniref:hypothetical protein n=1 Tax=Arthrobacter sp. PM3 TaxID=2017685 RepID=UPI000E10E34B|nr:hypothetical protein [Arthrobacter sp. PM3]AXJ09576.1 hypothetical protein CFN17_08085 [Arthrobacter sp. PM3]
MVLLLVIAVVVGGFAAVSNALGGATTSAAQPTGTQAAGTQESGAGAEPSDQASASASPGASDSPSATPGAAAGDGCEQNLVTVTAATDKPSYDAGEKPMLTLKVTNNNKVPCEVNMGTSQMEYMITSGSDRIFSSKDCQAEATDLMKTIAPGKSETANFPWQRNRTVQGCEAVEAKPGTDGAYYVFTARLAGKTSPKAVFQLY